MKLWDKGFNVDKAIENFTIGNDAELDMYLAPFDVLGNIAHVLYQDNSSRFFEDRFEKIGKHKRQKKPA